MFLVGPEAIAVFHARNGNVFATESSCPHKGGPLADGVIGGHKLVCPLHAFVFDLSDGEPIGHNCRALKTYPAAIDDKGNILISIDEVPAPR